MIWISARSGGQQSSIVPSSKYIIATRFCASTILATPSANTAWSWSSGLRISSVNTAVGLSNTRPK
jgi:hypothetical protein